jgi:hypothetical protein
MINLGKFETCVCKARGIPHRICYEALTFEENGKKVKLTPKQGEQAWAIVLDGCVCNDGNPRCDGLFLFRHRNRKVVILVELKGVLLEQAFKQLAFTRYERLEYREIKELFAEKSQVSEMAFIISNYIPSKRELVRLENSNKIRVKQILHSEATKPIPELRRYL